MSQIIRSTDVVLGFTGLNAISGIRSLMCATIHGATRIVNHGEFSVERFFKLVDQFKVTYSLISRYRVVQLANHSHLKNANLSSLKYLTCGGTKLSLETIQTMNKYLIGGKLCHNFGMTELAGPISINLNHSLNDSCGQLISGCAAKIINTSGERLGINQSGELCIKLPFMFLGYLCNKRSYSDCVDQEGFFLTEDIGSFDENGDLFIVSRKKDAFKSYGVSMTASEIEGFLNNIDGVMYSCVVPIPDPCSDNLPAALIVKTDDSKYTEGNIYHFVSSNAFL